MKIIDLTHVFADDMPVYPGDPKVSLTQTAFIDKDSYNDHKLVTQMHVGTHMDAPLHIIQGGNRVDQLSLEIFIGKGILVNAVGKKEIGPDILDGLKIKPESIVLIHTGFDKHYGESKYFDETPFLTVEMARLIVEKNVKMLGIDFSGPDIDPSWPTHKILLGAEIPIIENLTNLNKLESFENFEIIALPLNLKSDGAPVRIIAKIK